VLSQKRGDGYMSCAMESKRNLLDHEDAEQLRSDLETLLPEDELEILFLVLLSNKNPFDLSADGNISEVTAMETLQRSIRSLSDHRDNTSAAAVLCLAETITTTKV
jgi:hypothetical protein